MGSGGSAADYSDQSATGTLDKTPESLKVRNLAEQVKLLMLNFIDKLKRFYAEGRVQGESERAETILKTARVFLGQRRHQDLYHHLKKLLPETFGFAEVGILFYEKVSDSLYRLEAGGPDLRKVTLSIENVVRLPYTIGLTGKAVKAGHALIFNKGDLE